MESKMTNWNLKSLIVERFGTQADFAMKIKRQQSFVSEVISGRRQLSEKEKKLWAEEIKRESKK
jgi:hypothetical protein